MAGGETGGELEAARAIMQLADMLMTGLGRGYASVVGGSHFD